MPEFAARMKALMDQALLEAKKGALAGEVPVGALVVLGERVIARAHNEKEALSDPSAHAEILAMRRAAQKIGDWRLTGCTLVVTAEPCPMCMGAVMQTRLKRLIYGTPETKYGAVESTLRLAAHPAAPDIEIYGGVREAACAALLQNFFKNRRGLL